MNTGYANIQGQERVIAWLRHAVAQDHLPHALLFTGPAHVGKHTTALALARTLNCREAGDTACDACPPCRRILHGSYPDLHLIRSEGQYLRIDQIREIIATLALTPRESQRRVVILADAERMNAQAANALLKTLEEPPANSMLILCTVQPHKLLETVRSRCVRMHFAPLSAEVIRAHLTDFDLTESQQDFLTRFAQGGLITESAEQLAERIDLRETWLRCLLRIHDPVFAEISSHCARSAQNATWRFVLDWLASWFRDLALLHNNVPPASCINADRPQELASCRDRFSYASTQQAWKAISVTRSALEIWNSSRALGLEALWLELRRRARK